MQMIHPNLFKVEAFKLQTKLLHLINFILC